MGGSRRVQELGYRERERELCFKDRGLSKGEFGNRVRAD